jgi:hypothetical protein
MRAVAHRLARQRFGVDAGFCKVVQSNVPYASCDHFAVKNLQAANIA